MTDSYCLDRFVRAQAGIYGQALDELRAGAKHSHWMWFVFPQMLGLGNSRNAQLYAISGLEEARAYLAHDLLGARLRECTDAMLAHAGETNALTVFGPIDEMKFHSSMTLFERAAADSAEVSDRRFADAIEAFFDGRRDPATLEILDG